MQNSVNQITEEQAEVRQTSNDTQDRLQHMSSLALRNHAQEEKDSELMKNISNYSNMLEQQLLFDNMNISATVDSTPNSNILMTNLSHHDHGIPKNNFDV